MVPLFGAAYAAPNKGTTILYLFRSQKTLLNPPVNGKIQGLFKAFECFSSTFQDKFNFQGLFKTVLYIQVLFKPVRTLIMLVDMQHHKSNCQMAYQTGVLSLSKAKKINLLFPVTLPTLIFWAYSNLFMPFGILKSIFILFSGYL